MKTVDFLEQVILPIVFKNLWLDFDKVEQTEDGFSGYAQFVAEMTFEEGTVSKKDLNKHYEEHVDRIKATTTESPVTTTIETSTTTPASGSGDGSGDDYVCTECEVLEDLPEVAFYNQILIAELVRDGDDTDRPFNFEYILPESLEPKSFVVCVGECKNEGIWMMTGMF